MGAERDRYTWSDWKRDGFSGPPPWRRGRQPLLAATALALVVFLFLVFVLAASGRLP